MNPAYPDLIYNGVVLCLNLQLIILGVFKILSKEKRNTMIGLFSTFLGLGFIYNLYWHLFKDSLFFSALLAGYKSFFFAPLIYLYMSLIKTRKNANRHILYHLITPTFLFVSYIIIKFIFKDFYLKFYKEIVYSVIFIHSIIYSFYLCIGTALFKNIGTLLKPQIKKRYLFFYYGLIIYCLQGYIKEIIEFLFSIHYSPETYFIISRYITKPLGMIYKLYVIFFLLIESHKLKTFLFGKRIFNNAEITINKSDIQSFLNDKLIAQKLFKDLNYNIQNDLKLNNISEKHFKFYLKKEYNMTIKEYINTLRIKEFKALLSNQENDKYDITSISILAGFKSKATFYRVFKDMEGITPKNYKKTID